MILYLKGKKVLANKRLEQKFGIHAGRVWTTTTFYIDDKEYECTFDSRFGRCIYFQYKDRWYSISMYSEYCDKVKYSFNPIVGVVKFTTTKK